MSAILGQEWEFENIDKTASPRFFVLHKQSETMQTIVMWAKTDTDLGVVAAHKHFNGTKIEASFSQ